MKIADATQVVAQLGLAHPDDQRRRVQRCITGRNDRRPAARGRQHPRILRGPDASTHERATGVSAEYAPTSVASAATGDTEQRSPTPCRKAAKAGIPVSGLLPSSVSTEATWMKLTPSASR